MWDQRCSDDAEFVDMTPELQEILLNAHNKLRNQQAMGETSGYASAARMATMVNFSEVKLIFPDRPYVI